MLFDTAGSLGAVRRDGTLAGQEGGEGHGDAGGGRFDSAGMWDGPVIACHSDPVQPSTFLMQIGEEHEEEEDEDDEDYDYEEDEEEQGPGRRRAEAKTGPAAEGGMAEDEGPGPLEVQTNPMMNLLGLAVTPLPLSPSTAAVPLPQGTS